MNKEVTTVFDSLPDVVEQFLDVVWMERGLSENTLSAYRSDLKKFITNSALKSLNNILA